MIGVMGNDRTIDNAARVSYGGNEKERTDKEVTNLIRYLYRNHHTSPFEMVELMFHLKMPIFVMRQHVRHRTASLNEYSGRYSVMSDEFYLPSISREMGQSTNNKQQSEGNLNEDQVLDFIDYLDESYNLSYRNYAFSLDMGVSKEIARIQLPLANYTEIYWKIDLHNFFHYTYLRDDEGHAQSEIVQLARLMYDLVKPHVPISCQAFEDYRKNAITLSAQEQIALSELMRVSDIINGGIDGLIGNILQGREKEEFKRKIKQIIGQEDD